jgi:hypothetical protein
MIGTARVMHVRPTFDREFAIRHQYRRQWDTAATPLVLKVGASRRAGLSIRRMNPDLQAKVPLSGAGYCLLSTQIESALPLLVPPSRRGLPHTRQAHPFVTVSQKREFVDRMRGRGGEGEVLTSGICVAPRMVGEISASRLSVAHSAVSIARALHKEVSC